MSTISASTTLTTALQYTADTTGTLVFKTGATPTTALTIGADQSATFAGTVNFATAGFTNLSITGVATFAAGTVSLPSITTAGDTNTGIYFPAADTIAFTEGGVESMRIDSSGNVGIGNSNPSAFGGLTSLSIGGSNRGLLTVRNASNADRGYVYFDSTNFSVESVGTALNLVSPTSQPILFTTAGTERMRIDSSGNVGIGTTTPNGALGIARGVGVNAYVEIAGNGNTTGTSSLLLGQDGTGTAYCWQRANGVLLFGTNSTERMRIDSSGNVGIGTSSPAMGVHIVRNWTSGKSTVGAQTITSFASGGTAGFGNYDSDGSRAGYFYSDVSNTYLYSEKNTPMLFGTNNTERMRILSTGVVAVGRTDALNNSRMSVHAYASVISIETTTAADNYYPLFFYNASASYVGYVFCNSTGTSYVTSSDYRLKENVVPMTGALATVAKLNPVTYKWKTNGSSGQGFLAHELQAVVPEAVTGKKDDVDKDGKPKYQGIDTSFLVATLTAAIQELKAEFDEYKATHP
jgi:hypothetical protein